MTWKLDGDLDGDFAVDGNHHEGEGLATFTNYIEVPVEPHATLSSFEGLFMSSTKEVPPPEGGAGVHLEFEVSYGQVKIKELRVESDDVKIAMLRTISLADMRAAILDQLQQQLPIKGYEERLQTSTDALKKHWPRGDKLPTLLEVVATIYNRAIAREEPPTMAVANTFEVSRATASRMISKAREEGHKLVDPAPFPGKRKKSSKSGKGTS